MYMLEKIGQLILITLEENLSQQDILELKNELGKIAEKEDEVVVSFNLANVDGQKIPVKSEIENKLKEIIEFCERSKIRILSYSFPPD